MIKLSCKFSATLSAMTVKTMIPSLEEGRGDDYVFFLHNAGSGFLTGWPFCGSIGMAEFVDLNANNLCSVR